MAFHYSPNVTSDGLVMYLDGARFTSGSTTWTDISRFNNNTTLVNGPVYNPTNSLGTVTTDGTNDYISPSSSIAGFENGLHWDLNWTLDYWIKPDWSIGGHHYKGLYYGYYGIPFTVQPVILLYFANTQGSTSMYVHPGGEQAVVNPSAIYAGPQNNNRWMHLALVSNGSDLKIYYNGILRSTTATGWSTGLGRVNCVEDIKIDSNGKILVAGSFRKYKNEIIGYGLTRLNTDGTRDTTFQPPSYAYKIISLALSGSLIYPAGWYRYADPNPVNISNTPLNMDGIMLINETGSRVAYMRGIADQQRVNKIKVNPTTGKIHFASTAGFRRVNPDLTADSTWGGGTTNGEVHCLDFDSSGSIYGNGNLTIYSGSASPGIFKTTVSGARDPGFNPGTGFNLLSYPLVVDSNDKIYVGGLFTTYSGSASAGLVRINPNGTRDTAFNVATDIRNVFAIAIDNNGKIYVGGTFTAYSGSSANRIVRLNTDGSRDLAFNMGTGFDNTVKTIAIDSNNKVYVGGNFFTYSGSAVNGIVKLNSDGTIDPTFDIGTGFSRANDRPMNTAASNSEANQWPRIGGYLVGYTKIEVGSFKMYNKALTDEEVGANYSATRGRYEV